jgi:plasmid stabilization system protein ParE
MSYTIAFQKGALKDYKEACKWYRSNSETTENHFKEAIDQRLQDIAENPEAYSTRFKDVRAVALKKFPYLIFYQVEHSFQLVYVIAIWHEAREREAITRRV